MILVIDSSCNTRSEFEADQQLQRALALLHAALVRPLGGGRFLDGSNYIVLAFESDRLAALAALSEAGLQASELKPLKPGAPQPCQPDDRSLPTPRRILAADELRRAKS